MDTFLAHGDLDHPVEFAEREIRRHQNAPPHYRADSGQPDFDLQNRGGICRKRREALFWNGRLRPSFHPASLAPAVPLAPYAELTPVLIERLRADRAADDDRDPSVLQRTARSIFGRRS